MNLKTPEDETMYWGGGYSTPGPNELEYNPPTFCNCFWEHGLSNNDILSCMLTKPAATGRDSLRQTGSKWLQEGGWKDRKRNKQSQTVFKQARLGQSWPLAPDSSGLDTPQGFCNIDKTFQTIFLGSFHVTSCWQDLDKHRPMWVA